MKNEFADINDLVLFLSATAMKPLLDDEIWQCYGYSKTPIRGGIWYKLFPKKFELENYIAKEVLTMGIVDALNAVKKSTETANTKLLISMGVVDQFLSTTKHMFSSDIVMENLLSTYSSWLKSEKSNIHAPVILKSKDVLNKKDFARFMVGTIKLLATDRHDDFLLKTDYIRDIIEKSPKEGKLTISMSDEIYKKYIPLLKKKILNA